jgi:hypothetical protein
MDYSTVKLPKGVDLRGIDKLMVARKMVLEEAGRPCIHRQAITVPEPVTPRTATTMTATTSAVDDLFAHNEAPILPAVDNNQQQAELIRLQSFLFEYLFAASKMKLIYG